ncbi:MAG: Crp/Fnr family transcriptional regulator [Paracoccaceae bacterium]
MSMTISERLEALGGSERTVAAGQRLFDRGDPVSTLFVVREGAVTLCRIGENGEPAILQRAGPGDIVAEASAFSDRYHCSAIAGAACRLFCLSVTRLRQALRDDPGLGLALLDHMGRELRQARMRAEILSLKTVRARLAAWREWQGGSLPARGNWHLVADELGVSPEALYREMARLRLEGEQG